MKIRVLLIEDDEDQIQAWIDEIGMRNAESEGKENGASYDLRVVRNKAQLDADLPWYSFDVAVVDLRLVGDGIHAEYNNNGNAVVKKLVDEELAIVIVHTGAPGEAQLEPYPNVELVTKGAGSMDEVLDKIQSQLPLIEMMCHARTAIHRRMAVIFHKSIWPRWKNWIAEAKNKSHFDQLARHLASHVHEDLLQNTDRPFVHTEESYFVPPVRSDIDTGDLICDEKGEVWIVMTPRCDLATGKYRSIVLAYCRDIAADYAAAAAKGKVKDIHQHAKKTNQHFLPSLVETGTGKIHGPWFVEFDVLTTVVRTEAGTEKKQLIGQRFATLSPHFLPSLVERFGAHFSRIGTPNYE